MPPSFARSALLSPAGRRTGVEGSLSPHPQANLAKLLPSWEPGAALRTNISLPLPTKGKGEGSRESPGPETGSAGHLGATSGDNFRLTRPLPPAGGKKRGGGSKSGATPPPMELAEATGASAPPQAAYSGPRGVISGPLRPKTPTGASSAGPVSPVPAAGAALAAGTPTGAWPQRAPAGIDGDGSGWGDVGFTHGCVLLARAASLPLFTSPCAAATAIGCARSFVHLPSLDSLAGSTGNPARPRADTADDLDDCLLNLDAVLGGAPEVGGAGARDAGPASAGTADAGLGGFGLGAGGGQGLLSASVEEALRMQMSMQKQLYDSLEAQRKLQVRARRRAIPSCPARFVLSEGFEARVG